MSEPAHDDAAERAYLGCLFNSPDPTSLLAACPATNLYRPDHAEIWRAVAALHAEGKPTDWLSVLDRLLGQRSKIDGAYLAECSEAAPVVQSGPWYASIITRHARTRRLHERIARLSQALETGELDSRDAKLSALVDELKTDLSDGAGLDLRGMEQLLDGTPSSGPTSARWSG